jgi:hypothetical protein
MVMLARQDLRRVNFPHKRSLPLQPPTLVMILSTIDFISCLLSLEKCKGTPKILKKLKGNFALLEQKRLKKSFPSLSEMPIVIRSHLS